MLSAVWQALFAARNISRDNYRFFFVTNYSYFLGLVLHGLFIPLFLQLKIDWLAYYNIFSVLVFFTAFTINRQGLHNLGLILITLEIVTHAWLAVYALGWSSGFFIYLMALVPLAFFNPMWRYQYKIALAVLVTIFYLWLKNYSDTHPPQVIIDSNIEQRLYLANSFAFFLVLSFLSFYYSLGARRSEEELQRSYSHAHKQARTDALTSLPNRRGSNEYLEAKVSDFEHHGQSFTIVICDIDDFKLFNDQHGHECGDRVLQTTAGAIQQCLRDSDHIGRWGGEEFILILANTDNASARDMVERIRLQLDSTLYQFNQHEYSITMTFGLCTYDGTRSIANSLNRADQALYQGKQQGKNCTVSCA